MLVSTHSRLKAAGSQNTANMRFKIRFNTQPPEGGWLTGYMSLFHVQSFNTQPPEGGWQDVELQQAVLQAFQHTAA